MHIIKRILFLMISIAICTSCEKKDNGSIIIELQNGNKIVNELSICETERGFEIFIDTSFKEKIHEKKVEKMYLSKGSEKIEISLFNIFYTPKENAKHQTPLTPKGYLATFENKNQLVVDLLSTDKKEIYNLLGVVKLNACNK